jgi:SAM-dependent methyltransferase
MAVEKPRIFGNESYDDRFESFLNYTNQKILTGILLENFFANLKSQEVIFAGDDPVKLLDIGCGEGTNATEMAQAIKKTHVCKIDYQGLDYNANFIASTKMRLNRQDIFSSVIANTADAFSGKTLADNKVDLAIASHVVYHAYDPENKGQENAKVQNFLQGVHSSIAKNGIAILIHESSESDPNKLRDGFDSRLMPNTDMKISQAAETLGLCIRNLAFDTKLNFPALSEDEWAQLKNPSSYKTATFKEGFKQVLNLVGFVVQRDLNDLCKSGQLADFIDGVKSQIDKNGGFLIIKCNMQVLLSNDRDKDVEAKVVSALAATKDQLPNIEQESDKRFEKKGLKIT